MTKLRIWTTFVFAPLWRWKWLLLLCLLPSVSYGLFSHAGWEYSDPSVSSPDPPVYIYQGWPRAYLCRNTTMFSPTYSRFALGSDVQAFAPLPLLINIAVAVGASVALTYLAAWRFSHSQRWQYGLRDILAATIVVALPLAVVLRMENNYQADVHYLSDVLDRGIDWEARYMPPDWYNRPWVDLGLLSERATVPLEVNYGMASDSWGHAIPQPTADFDFNQFLSAEVSGGRHLRSPIIYLELYRANLNDEGLAALPKWAPGCRRLDTYDDNTFTDQGVEALTQSCPRLATFYAGSPHLTRKSLQSLLGLRELERIQLKNCSREISVADLESLTKLPKLKSLDVPDFLYKQIPKEQFERWRERGVYVNRS